MARFGLARIGALLVTSFVLVASVASCATTARINDVYMALDSQGDRRRNVFVTDSKEIHCVMELGIGRPGVTIEALIRQVQAYDFGQDKFFETNRVVASAEASPQPTQGIQLFDVSLLPLGPDGMPLMDAPFPPGRFQCEAKLDGELQGVAIFNVDFPDCPASTITPGTVCGGFYKNESVCPHYGVSGMSPPNCQCDEIKGWHCDPDP